MKLIQAKETAIQMLNAKLTVFDEHPILTNDCSDIEFWVSKIEECSSISEIVDLIKSKFKLRYLQLLLSCGDITYKDIGNQVLKCWNMVSTLGYSRYFSKEMFLRLLTNADMDSFMTDEEKNVLSSLPDYVEVYRGATNGSKMGMCWTLNKEVAVKYASKYNAKVYAANIPKKHILGYFSDDETIILKYRYLYNLTLI